MGQGAIINYHELDSENVIIEHDIAEAEDEGPLMESGLDEMVDVGNRRGYLLPGDLVELRYFPLECPLEV